MVELAPRAVVKEEVLVSATRNDVLIDDEPLKIEVLDREEVEEKTTRTPGDIAC
jgi:outer membrane receptor for ferrienterochelin and colicins